MSSECRVTEGRPRLASRARLRFDPPSNQHLLVFPEAALVLNETAAAALSLCDGERTVGEIVEALLGRFAGASPEVVGGEVQALLTRLASRRLIEGL
jgi:pyrroloquinoline quinone biosynthesis protein D